MMGRRSSWNLRRSVSARVGGSEVMIFSAVVTTLCRQSRSSAAVPHADAAGQDALNSAATRQTSWATSERTADGVLFWPAGWSLMGQVRSSLVWTLKYLKLCFLYWKFHLAAFCNTLQLNIKWACLFPDSQDTLPGVAGIAPEVFIGWCVLSSDAPLCCQRAVCLLH